MSFSSGRAFLTRMGLRNIRNNRTMSIASVLVLVCCLLLLGGVSLAAVNLNAMFAQFSSRNVIMVFLFPGQSEAQVADLQKRMEALPLVKDCTFVSAAEAYAKMQRQSQQGFDLLEGVDPGFLPDGFEVSPASLADFEETVELLKGIDPAVQRVQHFQGVAAQLSAVQQALTIFGIALIAMLLLVSLFIIASTVRAAMVARAQEIRVMKSVGASASFIRWPFWVEGIGLGLIGSTTAFVLVLVLYLVVGQSLRPFLDSLLEGYKLLPLAPQVQWLLPTFLGVGVLTGGCGSVLSISHYLKEQVYDKTENA